MGSWLADYRCACGKVKRDVWLGEEALSKFMRSVVRAGGGGQMRCV